MEDSSVYWSEYQAEYKQVIYTSQLIRFTSVCSNVSDLNITTENMFDCLVAETGLLIHVS